MTVGVKATGSYTTKTTGDRITVITWQVDVQPSKYVALPFTAKNPDGVTELHWSMHEHLADGSLISWAARQERKAKSSVTSWRALVRFRHIRKWRNQIVVGIFSSV